MPKPPPDGDGDPTPAPGVPKPLPGGDGDPIPIPGLPKPLAGGVGDPIPVPGAPKPLPGGDGDPIPAPGVPKPPVPDDDGFPKASDGEDGFCVTGLNGEAIGPGIANPFDGFSCGRGGGLVVGTGTLQLLHPGVTWGLGGVEVVLNVATLVGLVVTDWIGGADVAGVDCFSALPGAVNRWSNVLLHQRLIH